MTTADALHILLATPPKTRDHPWTMTTGVIKCGAYWRNIPGFEDRANCASCEEKEHVQIEESPHHLWLECENNGQAETWKLTKDLWKKTTLTRFPELSIGLIRGTGSITTEHENKHEAAIDSKRLRILIALTVWSIWKSRNATTIQGKTTQETRAKAILKDLITELVTKSWNSIELYKETKRDQKRKEWTALWRNLVRKPDGRGLALTLLL